jgi:Phosphoadenosine phosphosulfate reductase family
MKTEGLRQALDKWKFDVAFGGARRDEEKSRAKERIFSHRSTTHGWDPGNQRPELWKTFNTRLNAGKSMRVFPLSNWTELDVWEYIRAEDIPVVPLYFAKERPIVERHGTLIMVDDDRLPLSPGEAPQMTRVVFELLAAIRRLVRFHPTLRRSMQSLSKCAKREHLNARVASLTTTNPARWKRRSVRVIFDGSLANCHDRCPASLYWLIVVDKACAEANKEKIHGLIAGHDNYYCIEIDVTKLSNVRLACFDWVWDHCQSFILENGLIENPEEYVITSIIDADDAWNRGVNFNS